MHLRGDAFTPEQKAHNFAYYEARTVRDSSLSDGTQAVIAAETGHMDLAYAYMVEAALLPQGRGRPGTVAGNAVLLRHHPFAVGSASKRRR